MGASIMFQNKNSKGIVEKGYGKKSNSFFQPKLSINQPNDAFEQEADAMADNVMRMADNTSNHSFFEPAINSVQRKEMNGEAITAGASTENYISSLNGKGRSLTHAERSFFEPKFGYNFSNVQLHTDAEANQSARSINALAYTHGNNIVFGNNQYQSNTDAGKRLMAHELTHVMQQQGAIYRSPDNNPNSKEVTLAHGSTITGALGAQNATVGFNSAGPNAIGIIAVPSQSMRAPFQMLEPGFEVWGHTAVYVRINGRITIVRGFSISSTADVATHGMPPGFLSKISTLWQRFSGTAPVDVPSSMVNDAALFSNTQAKTLEYPVNPEFAAEFAATLPPAGAPGAPPRYQINAGDAVSPSGEGSNCVKWAIQQLQSKFGGTVGRVGEPSVAELGAGSSQGEVMKFIKGVLGRGARPNPLPNTTGDPVAGEMPLKLQAGIWLGRALQVAAPVIEFISNAKQHIPLVQNLGRTGAVGLDVAALPGLYKGSNVLGMKGGSKGAGVADLVVNLVNLGAHLLGAPKYVTNVTQAGAELTPSNSIFAGSKGLVDFVYAGATQGTKGLESVHKSMVQGNSGGMMQGYSMIGDLIAGDTPDIDLKAAAEGDNGIFAEAGVWWGDHIYDWLH